MEIEVVRSYLGYTGRPARFVMPLILPRPTTAVGGRLARAKP
jgi:hypothetical protein